MPTVRTASRLFVAVATLVVGGVVTGRADAAPPVRGTVDISTPVDGSSGTQVSPVVSGKATSPTGVVHVLVDGVAPYYSTVPVGARGAWTTNSVMNLSLGVHEICAEVRSSWDDLLARDCVSYTVEPDVARFDVDWPLDGSATLTRFQVQGSCQDGTEVLVSLDGAAPRTEVCSGGSFWSDYLTSAGPHTVTATLTYQGRALTTIERSFTATAPPAVDVEITSPSDATTVTTSAVRVEGTTNQPSSKVVLTVDGADPREPYVSPDGTWWDGVPLSYGEHLVCATTSDYYGTSDRDCVTVTFAIPAESLVLTRPQDGDVSGTWLDYEGSCHSGTQLRIELDGALYRDDTCSWGYFGGSIPYVDNGEHTLTVSMLWEGNVIASITRTVTVDTLAPAPPTVLSPAPGATIRSAPVTLSGTAESGSTVELVTTYGETVLSAPVAAEGTWSMTLDRAYLESLGVVTGLRETLRLRLETVDGVGNRSYVTTVTYTVRMR